jgi:hypothetical protein
MATFDPSALLHPPSVLELMPAITDPSTRRKTVGAGFVVWARIWSVIFAVLFVAVTALTLGLWLTDPEYTETTPVSDLSFFALGAVIGLGFVSQLRTPHHNIAGVQQAIIGILSLGAAGLIGNRAEPLVGSLLFLFAAAILLALHPARRDFFSRSGRVSVPLGVLSIVAAVPGVWYAASMLALAADAGPACFFGECAHGDRLAEMAAAAISIVLVGLLAALRTPGWRLPLWSAGAAAVVVGAVSIVLPHEPGATGQVWGALAVAWGVLFVAVGERDARRAPDSDGGR